MTEVENNEVESNEPISQKELKKDWKMYRVISAPEGQPTFVDEVTGVERPYIRVTEGLFPDEKTAKREVENSNYNVQKEHGGEVYEIMNVEEVKGE